MKIFFRFGVFILLIIATAVSASTLSNYSIAGVKTGMTKEQSITALVNHLEINKN